MKKLFLSLVALVVAAMSYAQNTLVATLTHGDEISMFYGVDAFKNAHAKAADGDVINLSGGRFNATNITKGITIRGTGTKDANKTYIINAVGINVPTTAAQRLNIEGCYFTGRVDAVNIDNAYFLKNEIPTFRICGPVTNTTFVNCRLGANTQVEGFYYSSNSLTSIQCINCFVYSPAFPSSYASTSHTFINCVIFPTSGFRAMDIQYSKLVNCILYYLSTNTGSSYYMLPVTTSAWNCVSIGVGRQDMYNNTSSPQNCTFATGDIFIDGNYLKDLTDEAKQTFLGNDGTPVGVYGGPFPYSMTPTYPTITKMNVANRTTADGKLSVEIEVSAAE